MVTTYLFRAPSDLLVLAKGWVGVSAVVRDTRTSECTAHVQAGHRSSRTSPC
jgi:hypothetical protein